MMTFNVISQYQSAISALGDAANSKPKNQKIKTKKKAATHKGSRFQSNRIISRQTFRFNFIGKVRYTYLTVFALAVPSVF